MDINDSTDFNLVNHGTDITSKNIARNKWRDSGYEDRPKIAQTKI